MNFDEINNIAKEDNYTNDRMYNAGLKAIKQYGIEDCYFMKEVKYWLMCNGFSMVK